PDGSQLVKIPNVKLTAGWNRRTTTAFFVVPIGYPIASPGSFWTDSDLRLANGGMPQNTGMQVPPFESAPKLWFSWHPASWNPNRNDLLTFARVIQDRLSRTI